MSARCMLLSALLLLGWVPHAQALETHRHRLPNGLRVVVAEQKTVPIVAINCLIDGGARIDPRPQPGLASFTADLLDEGTRDATGPEIAREIDSLGGSLYVGASQDWTLASASLLARDFRTGLKLVANSLRFPTFPADEIERIRRETLGAIQASDENPASVASRTFRAALFGDTPYGHPIIGSPEAVRGFTRSDVVKFHQENLKPDKTICAIVGDISPEIALAAVKEFLGDWSGVAAEHGARLPAPASARNIAVFQPTSQASIVIGQLGIARDNPDYFPLLVMNHILGGGGFTSRLVERVRTREGLVYSIFSRFSSTRLPGAFRVGLQTKAESAEKAIGLVREELARMHEDGATPEEIQAAKDYLTGSFPLRLDSTGKLSGLLAQIEYFGLGADYIETYATRVRKITPEEIRAVARKYLRPEALVVITVGPENAPTTGSAEAP